MKVVKSLSNAIDFTSPRPVKQVRKRQQPERRLQVDLVAGHFPWRLLPDVFWWHHPAGGRRSRITGAILKSMGAKPGIPDILLLTRGRLYALELKSERGRLSDAQKQTHQELRSAGAIVGTAGSLDQALDLLGEWGLLK
jgi:hypothetical protein